MSALGPNEGWHSLTGMARLKQLANFGRNGANSKRCTAEEAMSGTASPPTSRLRTFGQMAASLSDFYRWISGQAGHKAALPQTDLSRAATVRTCQKVSNGDTCVALQKLLQ